MKARKWLFKGLMVAVLLTCFAVGSVHAQVPGVLPDLSIWAGNWFKVKMTSTVYHFSNIGVKPKPSYLLSESAGTSYIKITGWDTTTTPEDPFLLADVYARESGVWVKAGTVNIYYFAGSNLKFVGEARVEDPAGTSLNLLFVFTGKRNSANTRFIKDGTTKLSTMGSAIFEVDDFPGSTERWAGSAQLSGPMIPESQLPASLRGL